MNSLNLKLPQHFLDILSAFNQAVRDHHFGEFLHKKGYQQTFSVSSPNGLLLTNIRHQSNGQLTKHSGMITELSIEKDPKQTGNPDKAQLILKLTICDQCGPTSITIPLENLVLMDNHNLRSDFKNFYLENGKLLYNSNGLSKPKNEGKPRHVQNQFVST